jgi:hypothetical protein
MKVAIKHNILYWLQSEIFLETIPNLFQNNLEEDSLFDMEIYYKKKQYYFMQKDTMICLWDPL